MKGDSEMITDLLNSMGTPGLICTVAALAFVFYCIINLIAIKLTEIKLV